MKLFLSKIIVFSILGLIVLPFSPVIWNNVSSDSLYDSILYQDYKFKEDSTNTSVNPIFIDNSNQNFNWSKTCSDNFWCSGSGVSSDPFIIENIFIDGLNSQDPILIQNSNDFFIIRNSTIINSPEIDSTDYGGGIKLVNVQNGELINNTFYSNQKNGIYLFSSSNINITENFIFENSYGLSLSSSSNNIIRNNVIYLNSYGLSLEFSSNYNTIEYNVLYDNTEAIFVWQSSHTNYFSNNNCSNNIVGLEIDNGNNNQIFSNFFHNNGIAGAIRDSKNIVEMNTFEQNSEGLYITGNNNTVKSNYFDSNSFFGLEIFSNFQNVQNNSFISNNNVAVVIENANYIEVKNNDFTNNNIGISLHFSSYNSIFNNSLNSNNIGLKMENDDIFFNTSQNNITRNTFRNNLLFGISIGSDCFDNLIYTNIFDNPNAVNAEDFDGRNLWNYTINGNRWSDYQGSDENDDYIGDTPYTLYGTKDFYPSFWDGITIQITKSGGLNPAYTDIGDVNNDGFNDILIGNGYGINNDNVNNTFSVLLWDSSRNLFSDALIKDYSGFSTDIQLDDANNDGYSDVIINKGNEINILTWNESLKDWNSMITKSLGSEFSYKVEIGDVNNDGYKDIVANTDNSNLAIIIWNNATNNWNPILFLDSMLISKVLDLSIADVNNDGFVDIVSTGFFSTVSILIWNNSLVTWNSPIMKSLDADSYSICVGDVNNDGFNDIASVTNTQITFLIWNNTLTDWIISKKDVGRNIWDMDIIDINMDGFNDIITSNPATNEISFLIWNMTYQNWNNILYRHVENALGDLIAGDVNNDGKNEILTVNEDKDTVTIILWLDVILTVNILSPEKVFSSPPEFTLTKFGNNLSSCWYSFENNSTEYRLSGLSGTIDTQAWNSLSDGEIILQFFLNNTFGDIFPVNISIIKDTIAPNINLLNPKNNSLYGFSSPFIELSIEDENLGTSWYTINGGQNISLLNNDFINQTFWNTLTSGTIKMTFYANDSAGNIAKVEIYVNKDILVPEITINSPLSGLVIGVLAPTFNLTIVEENIDQMWYSLSNETISTNNISITKQNGFINQTNWNYFLNDVIKLTFFANDSLGNIGFSTISLTKDVIPPSIHIYSPQLNQQFSSYAPFYNITIDDSSAYELWYTLDNGITNITFFDTFGQIEQNIWNQLPNGNIKLLFYAKDQAENIGTEEVIFIKNSPPRILNIELQNQTINQTTFQFEFLIFNDNGTHLSDCSFEVYWDGEKLESAVENLGNGYYKIILEPKYATTNMESIILTLIVNSSGYNQKEYTLWVKISPQYVSTIVSTTVLLTEESSSTTASSQSSPGMTVSIFLIVGLVFFFKGKNKKLI